MVDPVDQAEKKEEQTTISPDTGKRRKEQFVENLHEGEFVDDFFAVKIKNPPKSYKKGTWFDFTAVDKTGEISIKFWGGPNKERVQRLYNSFKTDDIVQIRSGVVEYYEGNPQISVNENTGGIRRCAPDEYYVSDYVPTLEDAKIEALFHDLKKEITGIKNLHLSLLLSSFFDDPEFVKRFTHAPSAMTHHHNYIGGNLEHTFGVVKLCNTICETHSHLNKDLLRTSAILHDIGKLEDYKVTAVIDKTEEGKFIGHIILGDRTIRKKIKGLREQNHEFPEDLENHLSHMILSHHGRYEWGSPKIPKIAEALALHQADLMDSQVKFFLQQLDERRRTLEDDWTSVWDSDLGRRRLMYLGKI